MMILPRLALTQQPEQRSARHSFGQPLVTFPMMFAVVYLSAKLGQVAGKGLFAVIRDNFPKWILYSALAGVLFGNVIEAGADIGGMAAAINLLVPIPFGWIVAGVASTILSLQIWGSYVLIRNIFRWLALALLAYIGAAILAKPDVLSTIRGTFIPTIHFDKTFLSMLVAVIGTSLSAYLYTWQSNVEVEEKIASGRKRLSQRKGATEEELKGSRFDILGGMLFSNVIMYLLSFRPQRHCSKPAKLISTRQPMLPKRFVQWLVMQPVFFSLWALLPWVFWRYLS